MGQTSDGKQLGIPGFGLSVSSFAEQTETIEVHQPELNVARTAVLDYFQSPMQQSLTKIFTWENNFVLRPGRNMIQFLRNVCRDIAASIPGNIAHSTQNDHTCVQFHCFDLNCLNCLFHCFDFSNLLMAHMLYQVLTR